MMNLTKDGNKMQDLLYLIKSEMIKRETLLKRECLEMKFTNIQG